ncbi:ATP-binding protein [Streptodolium elevatio]
MIDDVHVWVGASSAALAATATWLGHRPGQRRAAQRLRRAQERAAQTAALGERSAADTADRAVADARRQVEEARTEAATHWSQLQLVMAELQHLVDVRLPAVAQGLREPRAAVPTGLRRPDLLTGSEVAGRLEQVEAAMRDAVFAVRGRVSDSARAGVRVAAEEIQASLTRAQRDIDNAFDDHDELGLSGRGSAYARTLAGVDRSVTLAAHTVQRLRILTESWPGVQRANCTVAEIVESARGRILHSSSVDYTYVAQTGEAVVEGLVVEPVIVALTELLDNATTYSGGRVQTHVLLVPNGVRLTVDDHGLGMSPLQLQEAERALSSGETDVTALADPGRLGFAVIGRLSRTYGLRVGLSPSSSGGVRADLLIPVRHLVAEGLLPQATGPGTPHPEAAAAQVAAAEVPRAQVPATQVPAIQVPSAQEPSVPGHSTPGPSVQEPSVHGPSSDSAASDESTERTALGLPKRRPREALRRETRPRQQEVPDPGVFADGFARLQGVLAAGYDDDSDSGR